MIGNKNRTRKIRRLRLRADNNSGIIIIIVLWILVILTLLAVSLGRKASIETALTNYNVRRLKAKYAAWAGLIYSMKQIEDDSENDESKRFDSLEMCGFHLEEESSESKFAHRIIGEAQFDIFSTEFGKRREGKNVFGFSDEERKISINTITEKHSKVLENLMMLLGFDQEKARTVVASVIDWRDEDQTVSLGESGAEDDYYMSLEKPYHCKNRPFESLEELLLVKGATREVFDKLKNFITVYPVQGAFRVNFNTAPEIVLKALAHSISGEGTPHDISDADSLVEKIIDTRPHDKAIDLNDLGLNEKERAIFFNMVSQGYRDDISRYIRLNIMGKDNVSSAAFRSTAIVYRDDLTVVFWQTY